VYCSNRTIAISKTIQKTLANQFGVAADLIPNGVVIPKIADKTDALSHFDLDVHRYILLVSRFVPEKRHLDLVKAFRKCALVDWKVVLVGGLELNDTYVNDVVRFCDGDPQIVFTGFQSGKNLQELFTHAGAFVLPSSHEGLPIALLEALSYGLPVFASDIQANKDVGLSVDRYFELGNVEMLARKLDSLQSEYWSAEESNSLREWVRARFDWEEIATKTMRTYSEVLAGDKTKAN
jgi:glycosyltransferase involved in cell wall biosynthesis